MMKFNWQAYLKQRKSQSILACESDGFHLQAVIASVEDGVLSVSKPVESSAIVFKEAVADVVEQLQQTGATIPKCAMLLTPSVVLALLNLPVDPAQPRTDDEMRELVRWEMEPLLAQQIGLWSIGAILQGRGHIDQSQREAIMARSRIAGTRGGARFGELAVELGLVNRSQVDEALELQTLLQEVDQELDCGWVVAAADEMQGGSGWLACAVSRGLRERWVQAFELNQLQLDYLYPAIAPSVMSLAEQSMTDPVLEIHHGLVACVTANANGISGLQVVPLSGDNLSVGDCMEVCHELMRQSMKTLWVHGDVSNHGIVIEQLQQRLEREILPLAVDQGLAGLIGACQHFLSVQLLPIARIQGKPPGPPLYKQTNFWLIAVAVITLLAIVTLEVIDYSRHSAMQAEQQTLAIKLEKIESVRNKVGSRQQAAKTAKQRLDELQKQVQTVSSKLDMLQKRIPQRQRFIAGFMDSLLSSVSDELVIDSVTEAEDQVIVIKAWSLSEQGAQQFIKDLAAAMGRWEMDVRDEEVWSQSGRLGLAGYAVTLRLVQRQRTAPSSLHNRTK